MYTFKSVKPDCFPEHLDALSLPPPAFLLVYLPDCRGQPRMCQGHFIPQGLLIPGSARLIFPPVGTIRIVAFEVVFHCKELPGFGLLFFAGLLRVESVPSDGIPPHYHSLLFQGKSRQIIRNNVLNSCIFCGQQAYRPIGAIHQA